MKRSPLADAWVRSYLEAEGPDAAQTERMLAQIEARLAVGEVLDVPDVRVPELPTAATALAAKALPALVAAAGGSVLVVTAGLLWPVPEPVPHVQPAPMRAPVARVEPTAPQEAPTEASLATTDNVESEPAPMRAPMASASSEQRARPADDLGEPIARAPKHLEPGPARVTVASASSEPPAGPADDLGEPTARARKQAQRSGRRREPTLRPNATHRSQAAAVVPAPDPAPLIAAAAQPDPALDVRTTSADRSLAAGDLASELALIRGAYASLRLGHPERALAQLDRHAARFPHGELAQAREVARAIALCQSGDVVRARALAAELLRRSPSSPYAERLRTVCAAPDDP